jgi:hypothetical protein
MQQRAVRLMQLDGASVARPARLDNTLRPEHAHTLSAAVWA